LTWIANDPLQIIIVTIDSKLQEMQSIVTKTFKDVAGSSTKVMVLSIPLAGKRRQMAHGIQRASGSYYYSLRTTYFGHPFFFPTS
jgi:argonaute-like protein implicated in RNA metabolism and viral defense